MLGSLLVVLLLRHVVQLLCVLRCTCIVFGVHAHAYEQMHRHTTSSGGGDFYLMHAMHPLCSLCAAARCSEELSDDKVWVAIAPDALAADKDIAPDDYQVRVALSAAGLSPGYVCKPPQLLCIIRYAAPWTSVLQC